MYMFLSTLPLLDSWPIDELGTGALWDSKVPEHFRKVSLATLLSGTTPTGNCHLTPSHWKEFSGEIAEYAYLHCNPLPTLQTRKLWEWEDWE